MKTKVIEVVADTFENLVLKSDKPVIVDFYSKECPPCQVLDPILEKNAEKYGDLVVWAKVDRQAEPELAATLNVTTTPSLLFFKSEMETGKRLSGDYINTSAIRSAIEHNFNIILPHEAMSRVECDVLILGAGAAGLSSAIYTSRGKLDTIILDESVLGGQTSATYYVANYPGTPGAVRGKEIIRNMRKQAKSFGAKIEELQEIHELTLNGSEKYVLTENCEYHAKAVIIASGARPKALHAESANEYRGRGVHYCAICDGALYQGREVTVLGGGNSACEEAIFLTRLAEKVTLVHQFDHLQASKTVQDEFLKNEKISVIWDTTVVKVAGDGSELTSLTLKNLNDDSVSEIKTSALFVYIGTEPMTTKYKDQIELDDKGYIVAGEDMCTNIAGVFAAGDIRTKPIRQVVTAASDGAVAGIMAERYVDHIIEQ